MSAISFSISKKRSYSPDLRDDRTCLEDHLPPSKKRRHEEMPDVLKSKLRQITDWFFELKHINKFARMAFKCGGTLTKNPVICIDDDDDEEEEDEDDVVITDDDDDDEIQEIKENVNQAKLPLMVNGSSYLGSHCKSLRQNGAQIRNLSTRYHGKTNCSLKREPIDKRKLKPLVNNPAAEIEVVLGSKPAAMIKVEKPSESPNSNQRSANSKKSFHISEKSPKNASLAVKQADTVPVKKSLSKHFTANEVVRLQEKAQYKLLLDKYVKRAVHRQTKAPESVKEIKEDTKEVSVKHFRKQILEQPIRNFVEKYYTPCRLVPSKSDIKIKQEPPEITIDDENEEEEDEIQVVEMRKPSVKSVFNSPLFSRSWLSELQQNVREQTKETNKIVEDYERELEKIKAARLLRLLKIDEPASTVDPEFPELTTEMEDTVDKILNTGAPNDFISRVANNEILKKDMDTLITLHWLNDAVINSYFDLIIERNKREGLPSIYAFNTYFYHNLKSKGFSAVRRWTRKIDIFSFDIVFIPIHITYHWCLGVIDNRHKRICYYDSMGTSEEDCLDVFHEYLISEHKDKKQADLDPNLYSLEIMRDIPQQQNGSDCGMFTLKYAEYISRDAEITFNQLNMNYFRRRAVYELATGRLL